MSPKTVPLSIRPATIEALDHERLIDFQESQIAWLSSKGSSGQWGTTSIREANPAAVERTRLWIQRSEQRAPWSNKSSDWCRAYVAEAEIDGTLTSMAGLVLDSKAPPYVSSVLAEQDEANPFVYVSYLLSNRQVGEQSRGSGAALIAFAKEQTKALGTKRICLDCWSGNERKLVKYYESQGFVPINDFIVEVPNKDDWPGCVLEMRL